MALLRSLALIMPLAVMACPLPAADTPESLHALAVGIGLRIENDDHLKGRLLQEILRTRTDMDTMGNVLPSMPAFHRHEVAARLAVRLPDLPPGTLSRWGIGEAEVSGIAKVPMREKASASLHGLLWLQGKSIPSDEELLGTGDKFSSRTAEHGWIGRALVARCHRGEFPKEFPGLVLEPWKKLSVAPELLPVAEAWFDCAWMVAKKPKTPENEKMVVDFVAKGIEAARASKTDLFPWLMEALAVPGGLSDHAAKDELLEEAFGMARYQVATGQFDRPALVALAHLLAPTQGGPGKLSLLREGLDTWIPKDAPMRQPTLLAISASISNSLSDKDQARQSVEKALEIATENPNLRMRKVAAIALLLYAGETLSGDETLAERTKVLAAIGTAVRAAKTLE